jgi:hypothetical protein
MSLQRTPEWHQQRLGKATGSRIADATRQLKRGGYAASRDDYMCELISERLTGKPYPHFVTKDMENGTALEPVIRNYYAFLHDTPIIEVGFIDHPEIKNSGASSDGLVWDFGMVEFKCPKARTHLNTWMTGDIDEDYIKQIDWNFACRPERTWCDFVSFHPNFPEDVQVKIIRVARDNARISALENEVNLFLTDLALEMARIEFRRQETA